MNKFIKILVATAIVGLVTGVASASDFEEFSSDNSSARIFGPGCESMNERGFESGLLLIYSVGPNTGTYNLGLDFAPGSIGGPFVSHSKMRRVEMGLTDGNRSDIEGFLKGYVADYCRDAISFYGGLEVQRFDARINKRRTRANVTFNARTFWLEMREGREERKRPINFRYNARMDMADGI